MLRKPRRLVFSVLWSLALVSLLIACGPAPSPTPTSVPKPAPTAAPAAKPAAPAAPTAPAAKPAAPTAAAPKPAPTTAPAPKPAAKPAPLSEWVVGVPEETPTLDPYAASVLATDLVAQHLYDQLIKFDKTADGYKLGPMLAESWSRTDDRTWVFKIRKGVKFHNGDELTAADIKYSLDTYRKDKSARKSYTAEITSVEQVDPNTVKVTTAGPNPTLFVNLAMLPILPQNAREKAGEEGFARSPVGSGAFKFVEFIRGQRLVLEANPNYWRGQVEPKKLTLRLIADPSTRVAELKTGGVQIIAAPPVQRFKELQEGDTELRPIKGSRLIIYPFNTKDKPFDDVRVRQAVNYGVDRDSIIKNVLEGYGEPLRGAYGSSWLGYDPNLKPYPYDPAKARQLLADAGYRNGLETTWSISVGAALKDREIAEAVASQLAQVGIKLQLVPTERAKLQSDWTGGLFKGITSTGWSLMADPDTVFSWALYKRAAHKPDEKLNSLIEQSRRTVDPDQRLKVLREIGHYVHDQALWMSIHSADDFYANRKGLGWEPISGSNGSFSAPRYYRVTGG